MRNGNLYMYRRDRNLSFDDSTMFHCLILLRKSSRVGRLLRLISLRNPQPLSLMYLLAYHTNVLKIIAF